MSIKKYKPEQIVAVLRQIEVQIANGEDGPASLQGSRNPHSNLLPVAEGIRRAEGGAGKTGAEDLAAGRAESAAKAKALRTVVAQ